MKRSAIMNQQSCGRGLKVAVVGASGYAGAQLAALLARHPATGALSLFADSAAGARLGALHPRYAEVADHRIHAYTPDDVSGADVAFLALPHGVSGAAAAALLGRVAHVIDLSGDLRLPDEESYRRWYGAAHPAPALLGRAVYGLPELFGDALPGKELVACAGCYATCAQLAAAPALDVTGASSVTVFAASGTSGAGRKAEVGLSFSEVFGDVRAYRLGKHQHAPEIKAGLARLSGRNVDVTFAPHLLPIERGIAACVVLHNDRRATQGDVLAAFRRYYDDKPFVRVLDPGERMPSVKAVSGTNTCELAAVVDEEGGTVVVSAVLDNLMKGAAAQAVQVMNVVLGEDERAGLLPAKEVQPW